MTGKQVDKNNIGDLVRVETESANYLMSFERHYKARSNSTDYIGKCDAFVLETGAETYKGAGIEMGWKDVQELVLRNSQSESPKPIFYVDIPTKINYLNELAVEMLPVLGMFALGYAIICTGGLWAIPLMIPAISSVSGVFHNKHSAEALGYIELGMCFAFRSFRSAISAEKIDNVIAPALQEKLGKKPTILTHYGFGHLDMIPYLKHKTLRKDIIGMHKLWHYYPAD